jgi:Gram-negative bacterial TonB protein C-terminal
MMKKLIILILVFGTSNCFAQLTIKYFDFVWKETVFKSATFMAEIQKTDSGFYRHDYFLPSHNLQMVGLYKDSACEISNGYFTYYHVNEKVSKKGKYINDEKQGLWLSYHNTGILSDSSFYDKGNGIGMSKGWYRNEVLSDSIIYGKEDSQENYYWFDNGIAFSNGNKIGDKKIGTWKYFHKNGKVAAIEDYNLDTLKSRLYFDEKEIQIKDTANRDKDATFKKGLEDWRKFIIKNLKTPRDYDPSIKNIITVVIAFTIDEEGNVVDPYVDIPYIKTFDNAAMDLIKKSPKWNPAIDHNRKVKSLYRQPISFALE